MLDDKTRRMTLRYQVWIHDQSACEELFLTVNMSLDDVVTDAMLVDGRVVESVVNNMVKFKADVAELTREQTLDLLVPDLVGQIVKPDGATPFRVTRGPNTMGKIRTQEVLGERRVAVHLFCISDTSSAKVFPLQEEYETPRIMRFDRKLRASAELLRKT